ncbi:MAG: hypothetical protein IKQ10_11050 [Oscillospiraceae bacterium]|nr:hypothetical protein [Oscillospiraceae bacterium]
MKELTQTQRRALDRLEAVLLTEVPRLRFSCDGLDQEGRMCIEPGEDGWFVFFREMGLGEDVTSHRTFEEAALQLIKNVAPSQDAEERMRRRFLAGE